jgi:uncharacterized protein (TIGR02588 family)
MCAVRQDTQRSGREAHPGGTPFSEWTAATLGLLLFLIALGSSVYRGVWTGDTPPDIVVQITSVIPRRDHYLIQFRAENRGSRAAEGVVIEVRLVGPEGRVETSQTTIEYLPGGSSREGGLFVSVDPKGSQVSVRALGYEKP